MSTIRCENCHQWRAIDGNHDCPAISLTTPTPQMRAAVVEAFEVKLRADAFEPVTDSPRPQAGEQNEAVACVCAGDDCLGGYAVCSTCERCLLCSAACFLQVVVDLPASAVDCADCEEATLVCCDLIESRRKISDEHAMVLGRVARLERELRAAKS